eukprot:1506_1
MFRKSKNNNGTFISTLSVEQKMNSMYMLMVLMICYKIQSTISSAATCTYLPKTYNGTLPVINVANFINYVELGNNPTVFQADSTAIFMQMNKTCNNPDGCSFECTETAACYQSVFRCQSVTGCNILCKNGFACGKMILKAQQNNTSINIVCYKDSCQEMSVYVSDIASAHIHCVDEDACTDMEVFIQNMSFNAIAVSVNCYTSNACTDMNIYSDYPKTQLNMYQYSSGAILDITTGFNQSINVPEICNNDSVLLCTQQFDQDMVQRVALGTNAYMITPDQFSNNYHICKNVDGCDYLCTDIISCFQYTIDCTHSNSIGCNIICQDRLSCAFMTINAGPSTTTSISVECRGLTSCQFMEIIVTGIDAAAHIHCISALSCLSANIKFYNISARNNPNTSVSCYSVNACDRLTIEADGPLTKLNMIEFSEGVILKNDFGYSSVFGTVSCGLQKHMAYQSEMSSLESLVYPNFPCDSVTILCPVIKKFTTEHNQCIMKYFNDFTDPLNSTDICLYESLYDKVKLVCDGDCFSSNTGAPTPSPTNVPTIAPSVSPTINPSIAPTLSPSTSPSVSPTIPPTQNPTFSPFANPSSSPTYSPSHAPTYSPSQAPTRNPTAQGNIYDSKTNILFVIHHLIYRNYVLIQDKQQTVIEDMQGIIEQHYFSEKLLPSYDFFVIYIRKINDIPYKNKEQLSQVPLNDIYSSVMYLESEIEFENEYWNYISSTSQDPHFYHEVTQSLMQYFNNSYLNFTVANADSLKLIRDTETSSFGITFWTLNAILFICTVFGVAALLYNKKSFKVDSAKWIVIIFYGLQIYDVASDINLTTEIFFAVRDGKAHIPGEDAEDTIDSVKEYILVASGLGSLVCLIIPYIMNVYYASKIPQKTSKNKNCRNWFEQNQNLFITLVVFSGGCYPSLALISSHVFGMDIFDCGLSSFELTDLFKIRILTTVLSENVPQL